MAAGASGAGAEAGDVAVSDRPISIYYTHPSRDAWNILDG